MMKDCWDHFSIDGLRFFDLLKQYRRPDIGKLDMISTAKGFGCGVAIAKKGTITGPGELSRVDNNWRIRIKEGQSSEETLFTFAHEFSHLLIIETQKRGICHSSEEYWLLERIVDGFARELLLPRNLLDIVSPSNLHQLETFFCVKKQTLLLQLAMARKLPPIIRAGKEILCIDCGPEPPEEGKDCWWWRGKCVCEDYRVNPELLPEYTEHLVQ